MTRYIIGIDLGTTTNSVAYVDTESEQLQIQQFRIPQLVAEGYLEALPTLPSFCYLCAPGEWPTNTLTLPWKHHNDYFVGKFAQLHGAKVPIRLVQSAKSWLCHAAANRREKILPFEAGNEPFRISPVEASARYLNHLKEAWNAQIAKGEHTQEFEQQEIILTVPASFDEIARRLTVEAASQAGLSHLTLLEEPQAAFYSWLAQNETSWQHQLPLGSCVLVCDVGGGTTDFSLIEVTGSTENPVLQRMSVGDHLLLGGDNMDAAIAHSLASQFQQEISSDTWLRLKSEARAAKETLLSEKSRLDHLQIILQSSGASVIQNSRTVNITKQEILGLLLNGFLGQYSWEEAINVHKTSGMRAMGLPYESDPSISKHLARFLAQSNVQIKAPDFVLFNGGTMKPEIFQRAILQNLQTWFPSKRALQLPSYHLDLAVSRGAAYYGKVRRGIGVKISGGTARGYYLKLETENVSQALTLLPRGIEEGSSYEFPEMFLLKANTPVAFQLYTSHVRLHDQSGDLIPIDLEQLQPLPPIHTILRYGKKSQTNEDHSLIPVHLHIHLNAIGTLEITLKSQKTDHIWGLEFQLRSASGQESTLNNLANTRKDEVFDQSHLVEPKKLIEELFSSHSSFKSERIIEKLELQLQQPKREWSPSILRGLGDALLKCVSQRKISQMHEARWWNLAGLFLMPGYGFPLDDFRIKELWKLILSEAKLPSPSEIQLQKWICFRRLAGGFNKGQQLQLAHELVSQLLKKNGKIEVKGKAEFSHYAEKIRAFGALELIDPALKRKVGNALIDRIVNGQAISAEYWALARIGARHLFYGSSTNVVSKDICTNWIQSLMKIPLETFEDASKQKDLCFVIEQLARKSDCRETNLSQEVIDCILNRFSNFPEFQKLQQSLLELTPMTSQEQDRIFGEHLPAGLSISQEIGN